MPFISEPTRREIANEYVRMSAYKAFALNIGGVVGYSFRQPSEDAAKTQRSTNVGGARRTDCRRGNANFMPSATLSSIRIRHRCPGRHGSGTTPQPNGLS